VRSRAHSKKRFTTEDTEHTEKSVLGLRADAALAASAGAGDIRVLFWTEGCGAVIHFTTEGTEHTEKSVLGLRADAALAASAGAGEIQVLLFGLKAVVQSSISPQRTQSTRRRVFWGCVVTLCGECWGG